MYMKKLLAGLLAVVMLTGCSGSGEADTIHVYTRDSSSGTREAFEKGVGFEEKLTKEAVEVSSNDDMAAKVGQDMTGIGYTSLSTDFEKNGVKLIQYEGVTASTETVLDGSYGLQRPFMFVTRAKGDYESEDKEQLIMAFLDYLQNSTEGMTIVQKNGGEVDLSKGKPWAELSAKYDVLQKDNSQIAIRTSGSTSVEKTVKAALEAFAPQAGNFQIVMNQRGSSDAYKTVLGEEKDGANVSDIGFASREFADDGSEDVSKAMTSGQYCIDAVVAIVHADSTMENMTKEQLYQVFTGEVTSWSEVK